jgi:hypothetical protein
MADVEETSTAGKAEAPGPESKTPPEAKENSGTESSASVTGPRSRKRPRRAIDGAKRCVCKRCGHFLGEIKGPNFEALLLCHRCKTENSFAYQELI